MILIIDNYDSFTFNLVDYFSRLGVEVDVIRNDCPVEKIEISRYKGLVLSPGPETPEKANNLMSYLKAFHDKIPILGICLGHQAINIFFRGELKKGKKPMHGKVSVVNHGENEDLFHEIPQNFKVIRYHSLVIGDLGTDLKIICNSEDNEIMGIKHNFFDIWGVQFHPESILTEYGLKLLDNWLKLSRISD